MAQIVRPETILGWHRRLVAKKFDGCKNRATVKQATTEPEVEALVLRLARQNRCTVCAGLPRAPFALDCALDIAAQSVLLACVISMLAQGLGGVRSKRCKREDAI